MRLGRFSRGNRKRRAISELVGTLLMVAITLVAGAAAFSWVNGQASTSENAYGQNAAAGVNYLQEHFAPVTETFTCTSGACTAANIWIFNNGRVPFTLSTLQIQTAATCQIGPCSYYLNVVFTSTGYTTTTPSASCSSSSSGGFSPTGAVPIGSLSSPYVVTIPSCTGQNNIMVGQSYVITMTGIYGNVVPFQVTANG